MSEDRDRQWTDAAIGGFVARMAGSIALAIPVAIGIVGSIDAKLSSRTALMMQATAAAIVSAIVILSFIRWMNWRSCRRGALEAPRLTSDPRDCRKSQVG
jgi:ABC-type nickel/cobalt efflux system permease component RcnA